MSIYRAIVSDDSDPAELGRVGVTVPSVGDEPVWASVVVPFAGAVQLPEVGTEVWVAFEADDPSSPVVLGLVRDGN
ncbi:phage baseplate assembly protein V [Microbacterium sp. E-13]|uniref:phage baseplate assembly protein V n=1 Tax=Microbacterium sp. E-13 TaxID=3404048 RepID=UPI003CF2204B